jgi:hypothetical protein
MPEEPMMTEVQRNEIKTTVCSTSLLGLALSARMEAR